MWPATFSVVGVFLLCLLVTDRCGAPTCKNHAEDVAAARAERRDCVFLSPDRVKALGKYYKK